MSRTSAVLGRLRPAPTHVVIDPSPTAERRRSAWWRDGRVVGGVAILVVCTLAGARLLASGSDTIAVWQATRDLAAGATITAADVAPVAVPVDAAAAYLDAQQMPVGVLDRPVLAGELLPIPASDVTTADARWVTLAVEPLHAPPDLAPGERVDVWATSDRDLTAVPAPGLILPAALVTSVSVDSMGVGGEYGVTVQVEPGDAERILAALRTGVLDLVRTPVVTP